MRYATRVSTPLATMMLMVLAGCSSTGSLGRQAVTSPVGPSFVSGKGVQVFAASPAVMTDVKDAMTDVGIHSIKQVREPDNTDVFEGTTADNRHAQVAVQPRGSKMVVTTKIGWRGDEPLSRAVLDRISIRQGGSPAAVVPVSPTAPTESPLEEKPEENTRKGVPDSIMMRSQLEAGYNQNPVP